MHNLSSNDLKIIIIKKNKEEEEEEARLTFINKQNKLLNYPFFG